MAADELQQRDELLALESIFGADAGAFVYERLDDGSAWRFRGRVSVDAVPSTPVRLSAAVAGRLLQCDLASLPSVTLSFELPRAYPSSQPPQFDLSACWLDDSLKNALRQKLLDAWQENCGTPVLFLWSQVLRDQLQSALPDRLSVDSLASPRRRSSSGKVAAEAAAVARQQSASAEYTPTQLFHLLVDADESARRSWFERESHRCAVCFDERAGVDCIQFAPCQHSFCRQCVGEYFSIKITEGSVRQLGCLAEGCESGAPAELVRGAVDERLFERYDGLLLARTLELMPDVVPCPRASCQRPVLLDAADAPVGICAECSFIFCKICRRVAHGGKACARRHVMRRLASQGDERHMLEARLSQAWLEENSKNCPRCRVHIEKLSGCNKMRCTKCDLQFCWLCLASLDKQQPYAHFEDPNRLCYNQLHVGVDDDDEDFYDWSQSLC